MLHQAAYLRAFTIRHICYRVSTQREWTLGASMLSGLERTGPDTGHMMTMQSSMGMHSTHTAKSHDKLTQPISWTKQQRVLDHVS